MHHPHTITILLCQAKIGMYYKSVIYTTTTPHWIVKQKSACFRGVLHISVSTPLLPPLEPHTAIATISLSSKKIGIKYATRPYATTFTHRSTTATVLNCQAIIDINYASNPNATAFTHRPTTTSSMHHPPQYYYFTLLSKNRH